MQLKKNHCQTGEFQSKFHSKNHRFDIDAISVFIVKCTATNFSIEESKENDLIIKEATGKHKGADNSKRIIFTNFTGSKNK